MLTEQDTPSLWGKIEASMLDREDFKEFMGSAGNNDFDDIANSNWEDEIK